MILSFKIFDYLVTAIPLKVTFILCMLLISFFPSFAKSVSENPNPVYITTNTVKVLKIISEDFLIPIPSDTIYPRNPISFGLKSGINRTKMNFNKGYPINDYPFNQRWRTGFTLGSFMNIPLSDKWAIFQEYNYSKIRGDYLPYEASINLNYLSIPLLIRYSLNSKFHLISGIQFDLLISGTQVIDGITDVITKNTEERNIGLNLGLQYCISEKFFLEIRVMHGLNDIGLWQRHDIKEFKFEAIVLSGGYFFYNKPVGR